MGRFGKALLLAAVALPFAATSAYAQNDEVSAGETEAAASEKRLGSVVVKARKRDENLQEVPVVVQAKDS